MLISWRLLGLLSGDRSPEDLRPHIGLLLFLFEFHIHGIFLALVTACAPQHIQPLQPRLSSNHRNTKFLGGDND
jgi:hypothetical protein